MNVRLDELEDELMEYGVVFHDDTGAFIFANDFNEEDRPRTTELINQFNEIIKTDS